MPTLVELEAKFIQHFVVVEPYNVIEGDAATWRERGCPTKEIIGPRNHMRRVQTLEEAHGIWFMCPLCYAKNGGRVGTHYCRIFFEGRDVPDTEGLNAAGQPVRWRVSGSGLHDLSTQPSILLEGGCGWHGYITNGSVN